MSSSNFFLFLGWCNLLMVYQCESISKRSSTTLDFNIYYYNFKIWGLMPYPLILCILAELQPRNIQRKLFNPLVEVKIMLIQRLTTQKFRALDISSKIYHNKTMIKINILKKIRKTVDRIFFLENLCHELHDIK